MGRVIELKPNDYWRETRGLERLELKLHDYISDKLHNAYWDTKMGRGMKYLREAKLLSHSVIAQLRTVYLNPNFEDPLTKVHKICRRYRLWYCHFYLDLPVRVIENAHVVIVKDKRGHIVHKEKVAQKVTELPLPRLPQVYEPKPPGYVWSEGEKQERALKFLSLYASEGYVHPAARAVGVDYITLIAWINNDELLKDVATLANQSVQQLMEDVGRYRALHGSDNLLKFFLEHENPKFMSEKSRKTVAGEKAVSAQERVFEILANAESHSKTLDVAAHTVPPPEMVSGVNGFLENAEKALKDTENG